jgi:hypothetical protein
MKEIDLSAANIRFAQEARQRAERGEPPLQMNHVVMGDDFAVRQRNNGRSMAGQRVADHFVMAGKA